jgi:hypothetical protein
MGHPTCNIHLKVTSKNQFPGLQEHFIPAEQLHLGIGLYGASFEENRAPSSKLAVTVPEE